MKKAAIYIIGMIILSNCNAGLMSKKQPQKDIPAIKTGEYSSKAIQIIEDGLNSSDPRIKVNAIEAVATTNTMQLVPKVVKLVKDDIIPVRFAAAVAIGDMKYKLGEDKLKILLEVPDENTRLAAGYALSKLGNKTGIEILRKGITSKNQTIRGNAATLLGKSGDASALKLLYWVLHDEESDDMVQFQAVESIARLGDKKIFPKLWAVIFSGYADDRIMGVRAMGLLGTNKARDVLATKLDDEILEVRLAVAEQLGMLGDTRGEGNVLEVFEGKILDGMDAERVERVKVLAAMAIGRIGTDSLTKYLPGLLADNSKSVQIAASQAVLLCDKREKASQK